MASCFLLRKVKESLAEGIWGGSVPRALQNIKIGWKKRFSVLNFDADK